MGTEIIVTDPRIECKFQTTNSGLNLFLNYFKSFGFIQSFDKRKICSLYYDDFKYSSVADNLSGITPRSKYRLRWYSDFNNYNYGLRFEQKIKKRTIGIKKIINLDNIYKDICNNFSIENISRITNITNFSLLPLEFKPQLFCIYERSYYENNNGVRLTLDNQITFKKANEKDILYGTHLNLITSNNIIIEIKFAENQKSYIAPLLSMIPSPSNRCSKYLLGQSKLRNFSYL